MDIYDIIEIARQAEQDDLDRMEGRGENYYDDEDRAAKRALVDEIAAIQDCVILEPGESIVDLFANLRHLCARDGWDFYEVEKDSYGIYLEQRAARLAREEEETDDICADPDCINRVDLDGYDGYCSNCADRRDNERGL